jgi:cellulose synthase/poly-beta-1,6-N-acetylglucosamine synthase-like glycosyltransferase
LGKLAAFWKSALLIGQIPLGLATAYLVFLSAAAWFAPKQTILKTNAQNHRFLILVPAHNEESLLPQLLSSIREIDYPPSMYATYVIADNCIDRTAEIARRVDAQVLERFNSNLVGKGYALQWALNKIWDNGVQHDAVLILDADSTISPNFLRVMDARLSGGERIIQGYYAASNPDRAWSVGLRYAALTAVHYLRPQGKMVLGGSAGLKGNGMVFAADILKQYPWPASLTEDIEYHLQLILAGEKVAFAPDAIVRAEMPVTLGDSHSQNVRWERGRLEMVKRYFPELLRNALSKRSVIPLDAAIEQAVPPLSILTGTSVLTLLMAIGTDLLTQRGHVTKGSFGKTFSSQTAIGTGIVASQLIYVLSALVLAKAPRSVYRNLLYTPFFVFWKLWVYARVVLGLDRQGWIRTRRD